MPSGATLVQEKLDQAVEILREQDVDLWLTFVRETLAHERPQPRPDRRRVQRLAGSVPRLRDRRADRHRRPLRRAVAWSRLGAYEVIGYDESIRPALRETVERLAPRSIALNYSESDPAADGLTHGLWRVLQDTFADTPYADRFVPSEAIVNALRGRKSPEEVERIRARSARDGGDLRRRHRRARART